jgi:hypothetical protein
MILTGAMNRGDTGRPVLAVLIGVLVMQVIILIPIVGGVVVFLASVWGAGALAFIAYRGAGGQELVPADNPPPVAAA